MGAVHKLSVSGASNWANRLTGWTCAVGESGVFGSCEPCWGALADKTGKYHLLLRLSILGIVFGLFAKVNA